MRTGTINPRNVVEMLLEEYQSHSPSLRNDEEISLKNYLQEILDSHCTRPSDNEEESFELSFDEALGEDSNNTSADCEIPSSSTSVLPIQHEEEMREADVLESENPQSDSSVASDYKHAAVSHWRGLQKNTGRPDPNEESDDSSQESEESLQISERASTNKRKNKGKRRKRRRKCRKFSSVQTLYKKVKNVQQLYRWESAISKKTKVAQIQHIHRIVKEKFERAREKQNIIRDINIQAWGTEAARQNNYSDFKASGNWLKKFKTDNRIVSRKITKFVTRSQINNEETIKTSAEAFVEKIKNEMDKIGAANTYNSDQSGFNFEMRSGRTLEIKGKRSVRGVAQSLNATTHSYTIQPTINANGEFLGPLLLVLPEPGGKFGPIVSKTMFKAPNVKVVATRSGKCTSDVLKDWMQTCVCPHIKVPSLLLLDSYGGFNAAEGQTGDSEGEDDDMGYIHIRRIPKLTTGMIQPLDVYGFRPYKNFLRKLSDLLILLGFDVVLRVRDNVIKLQSLCFNQMSSPRYRNMFKYGWYKAGYLTQHPPVFQTPVQYSFPLNLGECNEDQCEKIAFIRCGWCSKNLCFDDFFVKYHLCEAYRE